MAKVLLARANDMALSEAGSVGSQRREVWKWKWKGKSKWKVKVEVGVGEGVGLGLELAMRWKG